MRTASAAIGPTTWRRRSPPTRRRSRSGRARRCRASGRDTQIDLGNAYLYRIRGDRADNLEKAIAAYEAALTVRTREALPREWAATQNNLGNAYADRIRGDRADNLEKAIAAYEAALTVRTREALPREWAATQNNLGNAYWSASAATGPTTWRRPSPPTRRRSRSGRARPARASGRRRRTTSASPIWSRIRGDRADNLEKAIAAYEAALTVRTREALPREWAALAEQPRSSPMRRASAATGPTTWRRRLPPTRRRSRSGRARPAARLGANAEQSRQRLSDRIRGDRADNLEKAIAAYEAALTVRTREALPRDWALTQNNLGIAYQNRIRGDRGDNLKKAIAAYEAALTVFTREALPRDHLLAGRGLGEALLDARQWHKAGLAFGGAREAFLQLFGHGLNDAEARDLIAEAGPLFAEAAFAAAERGDLEAALGLANEGRARQLRVALRRQGVELPAQMRPRHDALTTELRGWEGIAGSVKGTDAVVALNRVAALRKELGDLVAPYLPQEAGLTHEALPEGGAVVVPIVTRFGGKILMVTGAGPQGPTPSLPSSTCRSSLATGSTG